MAKKPVQETTRILRVTGPEGGRWRGGFGTPRHFTPEPCDLVLDELTDDEVKELADDPELKLEVIEIASSVDPAQ